MDKVEKYQLLVLARIAIKQLIKDSGKKVTSYSVRTINHAAHAVVNTLEAETRA